jgi:hypothetical protein
MKTLRNIFAKHSAMAWFGSIQFLAAIVLLLLTQVDERLLNGVNVWIKPIKFHLTAGVFIWTMAVLLDFLPDRKKVARISFYLMLCMAVETFFIDLQAARGVASHFNHTSIFNEIVYAVMGVFILFNTGVVSYTAYQFFKQSTELSQAMLWVVRLGLILFVIGSLEGGVMSGLDKHSVGAPDDVVGLFFLNWNTQGGDLRIAHFMGIHALQVIPLFAYLVERYFKLSSVSLVMAFALLYFLAFNLLFVQALKGLSLLG